MSFGLVAEPPAVPPVLLWELRAHEISLTVSGLPLIQHLTLLARRYAQAYPHLAARHISNHQDQACCTTHV